MLLIWTNCLAEGFVKLEPKMQLQSQRVSYSGGFVMNEKFLLPWNIYAGLDTYSNSGLGYYVKPTLELGSSLSLSKVSIKPEYRMHYSLQESYFGHEVSLTLSYKLWD
jgi:hypothetical protein